MWRISIHHDFDSLGVPFHPVVVIGLGKNLLFKSFLGHCNLGLGRNNITKKIVQVEQFKQTQLMRKIM